MPHRPNPVLGCDRSAFRAAGLWSVSGEPRWSSSGTTSSTDSLSGDTAGRSEDHLRRFGAGSPGIAPVPRRIPRRFAACGASALEWISQRSRVCRGCCWACPSPEHGRTRAVHHAPGPNGRRVAAEAAIHSAGLSETEAAEPSEFADAVRSACTEMIRTA